MTESKGIYKKRNDAGVHRKKIDWNIVDEMLEAGCFATHIADRMGISTDTLYRRCEEEKGVLYTAYSQQKKANGESNIHQSQYNLAVKDKNATMLIWLGKQRCGQKEAEQPNQGTPAEKESYKSLMDQIERLHETIRNQSDRRHQQQY